MGDEEIYLTCICGELVSERDLNQHAEDCLKDYLKNSVTLKINSSSGSDGSRNAQRKVRHGLTKCMRCGYSMSKNEGTLVTLYPSRHKLSVSCGSYKSPPGKCNKSEEAVCKTCKLPSDFHQDASDDDKEGFACIVNTESDQQAIIKNSSFNKEAKCREREALASEFLESVADSPEEHDHTVILDEIPSGPPCKQFHIALLPGYDNIDCCGNVDGMHQDSSLLLQVLDTSPPKAAVETQTDVPKTENVGVQVRILGVYPEEVEKLMAEDKSYSLPAFDPTAEAAFQSHLRTLIPCTHCSRTFSPDRIQRHIECCIERPRTRECATPAGGEMRRRR